MPNTPAPTNPVATSAKLADGREIWFFDEQPTLRSVHDERPLEPRAGGSQLRWDRLTATWTAVAGHRQTRTFKPPSDECPLCPSVDGRLTEIPAESYDVVAFENRFPALSTVAVGEATGEPFVSQPGRGRCEVVCFTSDHEQSFVDLPPERVRTVLAALAHRTEQLTAMPEVAYVFCFENRGEEIGVTLQHPHGQIYAMPVLPPRIESLVNAADAHRDETGECLQCAVLADEIADGSRVVAENGTFVAYVPYAGRWPYEIRVVPRRHVGSLPGLTADEMGDLAALYQECLRRMDGLDDAGPVPYIAGWQQAPTGREDTWHLAAEIFTIRRAPGRLKYLAGIESGVALWVNDIPPETAAERLRTAF